MPEKYKWPTITGLYQPIDYGNIKPFDTTAIQNTVQSMTDLVHALGFKTKEEEEEEKRKKEEERRKAEFGYTMSSTPAFPGDVPATSSQAANYYLDGDVEGAKATQAKQDAIGTTAAITSLSLPYSFSTIGTIPTLLTEAASIAGGYGGYKLGEVVDNKLGTKVFAPTFSFIGGMGSGIGSYKGLVNLGTKGWLKGTGNMYGKQFMGDVAADVFNKGMKQGNPYLSTYLWKDFLTQEMTDPDRAVHVSHNPMSGKTTSTKAAHSSGTKWVPGSAERSLVGDDNMIWLWEGKPYRNQWNDQTFISVPKSNNMAQTRQARAVGVPEIDLTNPSTKIITRNPITGGFERQIVVSGPEPITPVKTSYRFFERPSTYFKDATYAGIPGTYAGKEVPTWQLPRGQRNQHQVSSGISRITPEERMGIPKGVRNNGKYNGITFFRTLDVVPGIDDAGFVQVSSPHSLFSNFTTDNLVHTHSWYPSLRSHVIAVSPEAFRGSSLVSTEPSDMFFINNTLKIKPKHVTFISGDPEALALAKSRGFNIMTSPELQLTFKRGRYVSGDLFPKPRLTKHSVYGNLSDSRDNWNAYKDLLRETVTTKFSRPTFDIYKKISDQTGLPISVKPFSGKNFFTTGSGVNWSPSDFRHVVYDPASPIESVIKEKYDIPAWMGSLFGSSDFEKSLINFRLSKLKQSVTPLKNGGKIENSKQWKEKKVNQ